MHRTLLYFIITACSYPFFSSKERQLPELQFKSRNKIWLFTDRWVSLGSENFFIGWISLTLDPFELPILLLATLLSNILYSILYTREQPLVSVKLTNSPIQLLWCRMHSMIILQKLTPIHVLVQPYIRICVNLWKTNSFIQASTRDLERSICSWTWTGSGHSS